MREDARLCPSCGRSFGEDVLFCPTDGAPLARPRAGEGGDAGGVDPYVGLSILGQIEIRKLAGVGSMARVYRAFQHGIDRDVAVKILHRELSANPEIVERFHREARVASRIAHPNVVQVLLTAQLPEGREVGGELVLVMEYLDGLSLLSALSGSGGAFALPRALHVILQVCNAVAEAHAQGVVHRDLKPENVMLVKRGEDPDFVKVLDFGLARLSSRDATYATRAGAIFGSPRYISPEGAQGHKVGPPGDVYAIATMLYQCLAGRTPFEADSPVGFLLAHANKDAPRLSEHARASYVPPPIVDLLERALSKDPEARPADARVLYRELLDAAERGGILSAALREGDVAGSIASLSRTRSMVLGPKTQSGGTGTLSAPLEDLPPAAPVISPTLVDEPIAVTATRTRADEPAPDALAPAVPVAGPDSASPTSVPASSPALATVPPVQVSPALATVPPVQVPPVLATVAPVSEPALATPLPARLPTHATATPVPTPMPPPHAEPPRGPQGTSILEPGEQRPSSTGFATTTPQPLGTTPPGAPLLAALDGRPSGVTPFPADARVSTEIPEARPSMSATHVRAGSSEPTSGAALPTPPPDEPEERRRSAWVMPLLVAACFAGGAALAAVGATRLGIVATQPPLTRADALLAEANEAGTRHEWDTPPQRNVRDLLARGRSEFPGDARFVEAQRRLSMDATVLAVRERQAGHDDEALRIARIAVDIDRDNVLAQNLVRELTPTPRSAPSVASPPSSRPGPRTDGASRVAPQAPGAPRAPASQDPGAPDGGRWLLRGSPG